VELVEGSPTYSIVRLPDGRESTVSTSDLAPCPPADNDSTDPPTTDSSLPESDGVGGVDLGDVPADEADGVRGEGQNDESSVPEVIVSDTEPALPRRSTRRRKPPDRYGFNVSSIWMGVIVEIRVLLPRPYFVSSRNVDCCHDSSGQFAFVFHGECWASLLVVVAIMCSWHWSLFLQMETAILC